MIKFEVSDKKENEEQMTAIYINGNPPLVVKATKFAIDINIKKGESFITNLDGETLRLYIEDNNVYDSTKHWKEDK